MRHESPARLERADRRWAAGILLGLSAVYWNGHCRTFGPGDSAQHVLSAVTWGVSRPPGYPLYTAVGHLMSLLPFASAASWVNAFSGFLQAAASAVFFLLLRRWKCGRSAALTATALLSFSSLYWYYAEVAEVRALNDLLAVTAALVAVEGPLWLLGTIVGLGIGHHPTYILILPAICYLRLPDFKRTRDCAAPALCAVAACSAPYALLFIRLKTGAEPVYNPDGVQTAKDILDLFLRKHTGGLTSFAGGVPGLTQQGIELSRSFRELSWFGGAAVHDMTLAGVFLAALGFWSMLWTRRRAGIFWTLWILGTLLPVVFITSQEVRTGDQDYLRAMVLRHYLPPLIGLFAVAGFGVDAALARTRRQLGWALVAVAALSPLLLRPVDLSRVNSARAYADDILRSSGPRDMILLTSDDAIFPLKYIQLVERGTADRVFLVPAQFQTPPYIDDLATRHPDLKLPRDGSGLSRSLRRWRELNPDRPLEGEPTMRDSLIQVSSACFPNGVLVRVGSRFPPLADSAAQAREFLAKSPAELVPAWGLRPWTQEVYLLKAYAMILEFYGSFVRRAGDEELARRLQKDFDAVVTAH